MNHTIDTNKKPFVPSDSWKVESHIKMGKLDWNQKNVSLYLSEKQKTDWIKGTELQKEIKNPLNANVLDWLLEHKEEIPEEWKGKYVFFWGTIYRNLGGRLYFRYLGWDGGQWDWRYGWLGSDWGGNYPAAVLSKYLEPQKLGTDLSLESLHLRLEKLEKLFNPDVL